MEFISYDAGSDVEGSFPEAFRNYVRDQNFFCQTDDFFWFFIKMHQSDADRDITDKFARLFGAITFFRDQCLVQFWRAEELPRVDDFGERRFRLTTRNQPFMLVRAHFDKTPFSEAICSYQMNMVDIITGDGGGGGGVIGRVFRNKSMECTPNIGYYSYEEHSHRDLALFCHIKFSFAIPLSDSSGRSIGVLEIVSSVQSNIGPPDLLWPGIVLYTLSSPECFDCSKDICEQDNSLKEAVSEIREVMQVVGRSCCLVCAQTWMMCNRCSYLHTSKRLGDDLSAFYKEESFEHTAFFLEDEYLFTLKKGEGVIGKAAASSHNLVYCDDVSQFNITEYPLAHFARHHKLTACFAICLRSNRTGNWIYVLEFFLNPNKVHGRGPRAMFVPILEGMRKNFRTFKFASGEEIGDNLSVQVIDARFPDKFESLEIGRLDSIENCPLEMNSIHNGENVVNTIEGGGDAIASLDKQHNSFEISGYNRGELADVVFLHQPVHIDGVAIDHGENIGSNINERHVAIASLENQHNNATIPSDDRGQESAIGVIHSDISLQPLVEANLVHPEENIVGASEECIINSSKRRGGIDVSLEELQGVSGMKRREAANRLKVSLSTFKRICKFYEIPRWPPRKKNLDQTRSGSTKELRGSAPTVMIKAKYGDKFIKFELSASSGINVFHQEVSKRLNLEAGSYDVKYQDDDNDWILVACDDDLRHYISSSTSLGKTTLKMLLERI